MKKSTKILIGFLVAMFALAFILPPILLQKADESTVRAHSTSSLVINETVAPPDSID